MQLRDDVRSLIHHDVGDGDDTRLWFDSWLPLGPIIQCFGEWIIYDSGLPKHTRESSIIHDGQWLWPLANSPDLLTFEAVYSCIIDSSAFL